MCPDQSQFFQLSRYQERLSFLEALNTNSPSQNIVAVMRIKGKLDQDLLNRSFAQVIDRHAILRTRFIHQEGRTYQQINSLPAGKIIESHDLSHLASTEQDSKLEEWAQAAKTHVFDIGSFPLFNAKLAVLSPIDHDLLFYASRLIFDERSYRQLVSDVSKIYSMLAASEPFDMPAMPLQFHDHVVKERHNPDGTVRSYWQNQLKGAPQILELIPDYPRSTLQGNAARRQKVCLSQELTGSIEEYAERAGISMRAMMMGAFCVLIHRYTARDDFLVGSCLFPRNQPEAEGLIGPLSNMLILRAQPNGAESFSSFIPRFQKTLQGAEEHHAQPYEDLINILKPERDLGRQPLAQVMFEYHETSPEHVDGHAAEWQIEKVMIEPNIVEYDVSLQMWKVNDRLEGWFTYSSHLYTEETIQRMLNNFEVLLTGIMADPDKQIARLPILTDDEHTLLLDTWNQTEREVPHHLRFHQIFEDQVEKGPDRMAASYEGHSITYDKLNKAVNRLGRVLLAEGLQLDDVVAIHAQRDIDFLIAILAIFKTGGVYLPLDLRHPPARIQQVLEQSEAKIVLVADEFSEVIAKTLDQMPEFEKPKALSLKDAVQQEMDDSNLGITYPPEKLAYIIFTSGSTGKPKGAMVEHRGMLNHLYGKIFDLELTGDDRVVQNAPQSFDVNVFQFVVALLLGGTTHIYGDRIAHSPQKLMQAVADDGITFLEVVPTIMRVMVDILSSGKGEKYNFSKLRWLMSTGDTLPLSLTREWLALYPDIPVMNSYGPTECSDDIAHYPILTSPSESVISIPIGRPIANMKTYILDSYLSPVPIGVTGEIYVGGIGVGKGYINDPERTALAFMSDPFSDVPGARMYKTGDLGRYLPDGNLEFLGRIDFQVKVSGHRIELKEIEAVLEKHPAVKDVIVTTHTLDTSRQVLVAYVVPVSESGLTQSHLRRTAQESLPEYMIPSVFELMTAFPETSSGKIDRNALPMPVFSQEDSQYVPPTNDIEKELDTIWCKLLGAKKVSIRDNYFRLGGDSMGAVILFSHIHGQFGVDLHLSTIYKASTIQQLAELIEQSKKEGVKAAPSLVPIKTSGTKPPFFLIHGDGGHVLFFNALGTYMDKDQPYYAFQAQGLDGREPPLDDVRDMAIRYLSELREFMPVGPYYLGGDCMGGYIALEMAQMLKEAGEQIAFLGMIDTQSPLYIPLRPHTSKVLYHILFYVQRVFGIHLMSLLGRGSEVRRQYLTWLKNHLLFTVKKLRYRIWKKLNLSVESDPLVLVSGSMFTAEEKYKSTTPAKPYEGKITMFRAGTLPPLTNHANDFGWSRYSTQDVEVHVVPGYLYDIILEPSVKELAVKLKESLEAAQPPK
jgi:amino acid adenylation domain-containing protein